MPRVSSSQANAGRKIQRSELKPGDIVYWNDNSIGHVAIYVGNNKVIHAPNEKEKVKIVTIWGKPVSYVRILKD